MFNINDKEIVLCLQLLMINKKYMYSNYNYKKIISDNLIEQSRILLYLYISLLLNLSDYLFISSKFKYIISHY